MPARRTTAKSPRRTKDDTPNISPDAVEESEVRHGADPDALHPGSSEETVEQQQARMERLTGALSKGPATAASAIREADSAVTIGRRRFTAGPKLDRSSRADLIRVLQGWTFGEMPQGRRLLRASDDHLRQYIAYLQDWAANKRPNTPTNVAKAYPDFLETIYTPEVAEDGGDQPQ